MIWQKRLRQKRCARGKLVGEEEEIFRKSYKLKVWHRFQNHNFITFKEGRLTSNLGLQNVGSLTLCIYGGYSKKICFTKKNIVTVKKNPKKPFSQKNFLLNMNLKNVVKQKRCTRVTHITWRRKNFNQKKKQNCSVAFISKKYLKAHFRDPKKHFFQYRILRSVSICSLYLLQTVVKFDQISVHPTVY